MAKIVKAVFILAVLLTSHSGYAVIKVAVASNFKQTLSEIAALYQQQTGEEVLISSASTGTLYNQIKHGAPFDLFLSADSHRAKLIEDAQQGVDGSRFTYAQGRLAFWSPNLEAVSQNSLVNFNGRLAIANPQLAPYGLAAKQSLVKLNLWNKYTYIQGANISQTYQYIDSGNAQAGLVAYSLLLQNNERNYYLIPEELYQPILQQGVLLSNSSNKIEVNKFIDYLQSDSVKTLIRKKGYL